MTTVERSSARETTVDIAAIVRRHIIDEFLLGTGDVGDSASLLASGTIDSTGIVELATWLEVRFDIEIDDEDMTTANLDSIERIAGFVARRHAALHPGVRLVE